MPKSHPDDLELSRGRTPHTIAHNSGILVPSVVASILSPTWFWDAFKQTANAVSNCFTLVRFHKHAQAIAQDHAAKIPHARRGNARTPKGHGGVKYATCRAEA